MSFRSAKGTVVVFVEFGWLCAQLDSCCDASTILVFPCLCHTVGGHDSCFTAPLLELMLCRLELRQGVSHEARPEFTVTDLPGFQSPLRVLASEERSHQKKRRSSATSLISVGNLVAVFCYCLTQVRFVLSWLL